MEWDMEFMFKKNISIDAELATKFSALSQSADPQKYVLFGRYVKRYETHTLKRFFREVFYTVADFFKKNYSHKLDEARSLKFINKFRSPLDQAVSQQVNASRQIFNSNIGRTPTATSTSTTLTSPTSTTAPASTKATATPTPSPTPTKPMPLPDLTQFVPRQVPAPINPVASTPPAPTPTKPMPLPDLTQFVPRQVPAPINPVASTPPAPIQAPARTWPVFATPAPLPPQSRPFQAPTPIQPRIIPEAAQLNPPPSVDGVPVNPQPSLIGGFYNAASNLFASYTQPAPTPEAAQPHPTPSVDEAPVNPQPLFLNPPVNVPGLVGLPNLLNSCYINSIMQLILTMDPQEQERVLLSFPAKSLDFKTAIQDVIEASKKGLQDMSPVMTKLRKSLFSLGRDEFSPDRLFHQMDAPAFLGEVLRNYHFVLSKTIEIQDANEDYISKVARDEEYNICALPIPAGVSEFTELVHHFAHEKNNDLNNAVNVDTRKGEVAKVWNYINHFQFKGRPNYLFIQLNRYETLDQISYKKLSSAVNVPEKVDFRPFMVDKAQPNVDFTYELVGVVNHGGQDPTIGHYVANVKREGQWYHCNDNTVTPIGFNSVDNTSSYVLMFKLANG